MSILIDSILALLVVYMALQSLLAKRLTQSVFLFFCFWAGTGSGMDSPGS